MQVVILNMQFWNVLRFVRSVPLVGSRCGVFALPGSLAPSLVFSVGGGSPPWVPSALATQMARAADGQLQPAVLALLLPLWLCFTAPPARLAWRRVAYVGWRVTLDRPASIYITKKFLTESIPAQDISMTHTSAK